MFSLMVPHDTARNADLYVGWRNTPRVWWAGYILHSGIEKSLSLSAQSSGKVLGPYSTIAGHWAE